MRDPSKKRRKLEEVKELELSNYDLDIKTATLQQEIDGLKSEVIEYSDRLGENIKYKDIVQNLIEKGVINEHGEEKISF